MRLLLPHMTQSKQTGWCELSNMVQRWHFFVHATGWVAKAVHVLSLRACVDRRHAFGLPRIHVKTAKRIS